MTIAFCVCEREKERERERGGREIEELVARSCHELTVTSWLSNSSANIIQDRFHSYKRDHYDRVVICNMVNYHLSLSTNWENCQRSAAWESYWILLDIVSTVRTSSLGFTVRQSNYHFFNGTVLHPIPVCFSNIIVLRYTEDIVYVLQVRWWNGIHYLDFLWL